MQNVSILSLSVKLTADAKAHTFVSYLGGAPSAANPPLGVAQYDGDAGDMITLDVIGTAKMLAGGAIAVGDAIEAGANGKGVKKNAGAAVARALEAAKADGDIVEVFLLHI
jgi:hypothetical protein